MNARAAVDFAYETMYSYGGREVCLPARPYSDKAHPLEQPCWAVNLCTEKSPPKPLPRRSADGQLSRVIFRELLSLCTTTYYSVIPHALL